MGSIRTFGRTQPSTGSHTWPRERLLMMDRRFCERVERAFKNGGEHRESAAMNGANASRRLRRASPWMTPRLLGW